MLGRLFCCRKRRRDTISLLPCQNPRQDFNCVICMEPIVGAVMTTCGHLFCEECLSEHFLSRSVPSTQDCPMCRENIQRHPVYRCVQLDGVIDSAVKPEDRSIWRERVTKYEGWTAQRRLNKVEVGMEIDVLDTEGVWCPGVIRLIVYSEERFPLVKVHYIGWSTRFDEYIPANSNRLGPKGFYTERARRKYVLREPEDNVSGVIIHRS